MRSCFRLWLPALGLGMFLVAIPAWSPISAQFRSEEGVGLAGGFGVASATPHTQAAPAEAPRVHYREPISFEAATTHAALGKRNDFLFPNETPLEDFLDFIVQSSKDEEHLPHGLNIHLDAVGLLEAERTPQSPILVQLRGVPTTSALELALQPLELTWFVRPDGVLVITSDDSKLSSSTPSLGTLLDEVRALREEIAALKTTVETGK